MAIDILGMGFQQKISELTCGDPGALGELNIPATKHHCFSWQIMVNIILHHMKNHGMFQS
jgi:hypothetical protein